MVPTHFYFRNSIFANIKKKPQQYLTAIHVSGRVADTSWTIQLYFSSIVAKAYSFLNLLSSPLIWGNNRWSLWDLKSHPTGNLIITNQCANHYSTQLCWHRLGYFWCFWGVSVVLLLDSPKYPEKTNLLTTKRLLCRRRDSSPCSIAESVNHRASSYVSRSAVRSVLVHNDVTVEPHRRYFQHLPNSTRLPAAVVFKSLKSFSEWYSKLWVLSTLFV